jgi:hypothetical protein
MVAMSEVIDPVKIERPVTLTKAQQQELKQRRAEWERIPERKDAIKLIMSRFKTTRGHARKLLKDCREEVEHGNYGENDDPDCDYAWNKDDLSGWIDWRLSLQQPKPVTEQPRLVRKRRRRDKQDWARKAIVEIWGEDVPDEIELPPKSFYDQVIEHLKADCEARKIRWRGISEKTVSRARRRK